MIATYTIPAANRETLEAKLAEINKRALKLGATPISATFAHSHFEDYFASETAKEFNIVSRREWLTVEINGDAPKLNGWTFVGTISATDEGNILSLVPGETVPVSFRSVESFCDHCRTRRDRSLTYIVRSSDNAFRQIGSNCLGDYLGHADPHRAARWAEILGAFSAFVRDEMSEFHGSRAELAYSCETYLSWTALAIRMSGWVSRGRVKEDGFGLATADRVWTILNPSETPEFRKAAMKGWTESTPSADDRERAKTALEWAQNLTGELNDFQSNIRVVARLDIVNGRRSGLAAAIMIAWLKEMEMITKRAERKPSLFLGVVGKRYEFDSLTVDMIRAMPDNGFGITFLLKLIDESGNVLTTFTGGEIVANLKEGDTLPRISGSVKKHNEYQGRKETQLSRVTGWTLEAIANPKNAKKIRRAETV